MAQLSEDFETPEYGIIVSTTGTSTRGKHVSYTVTPTSTEKDKAVLGVYSSEYTNSPENELGGIHSIFALGDGHILVCSEGGDIEVGDYICSSNTEGHGMKQDDDLLHNYTVAKATEAVDWSVESVTVKLISCTYHCG